MFKVDIQTGIMYNDPTVEGRLNKNEIGQALMLTVRRSHGNVALLFNNLEMFGNKRHRFDVGL